MQKAFQKNLNKQQKKVLFQNQDDISKVEKALDSYSGPTPGEIIINCDDSIANLKDPKDYAKNMKNLIVFDDVMMDPQSNISKFFSRGRHNNIDLIYLSQNYFILDRRTIRENCNFFLLFKQNEKNLHHIYQDCAAADVSFDLFRSFCQDVWETPHNFVTIDYSKPVELGRFRKNFNQYWSPSMQE